MWPFSTYPEKTADDVAERRCAIRHPAVPPKQRFGLIEFMTLGRGEVRRTTHNDPNLCLGGTAGCLIAHRLSASPNISVLVLDKGRVNAGVLSQIPLLGIIEFMTLGRGEVRRTTHNDVVERLPGYIVRCLLWIC
jgi:hypothetical protein